MLAIILMLFFGLYVVFFLPVTKTNNDEEPAIRKAPQMKKLWSLAQNAMKERKPLKAEKALLTILRFDEKNAAAYNRLGILYAKEKQYKDAIECFEIAQSLDNNASSLHNVGLIYLETKNYEKAAMAFSQAIALEGDLPARYIAYAKATEQLGQKAKALEALEAAYDLDPSTTVLRHILEVYERSEDEEGIIATKKRISELLESKTANKARNNTKRNARTQIPTATNVTTKSNLGSKTRNVSPRRIIGGRRTNLAPKTQNPSSVTARKTPSTSPIDPNLQKRSNSSLSPNSISRRPLPKKRKII